MAYSEKKDNSLVLAQNEKTLAKYLRSRTVNAKMQEIAAAGLDPRRLLALVDEAARSNPALMECSPRSVVSSTLTSAQLGLECVGPLQQAYLVPFFNNKTGQKEAQLQIGYRGLLTLARRTGLIERIEAHPVYEKDTFEVEFGLNPILRHVPYYDGDPGPLRLVYSLAVMTDGQGMQIEVMNRAQVEHVKGTAKTQTVWNAHYDEMARKTVVKRMCKYLPLSVEMAEAVALDNAAETGQVQRTYDVDITPEEDDPLALSETIEKAGSAAADMLNDAARKAAENNAEDNPDGGPGF